MEPKVQKPYIGGVVIFYDGGHPPRAATVAFVWPDGSVNLSAHDTDGSMFSVRGVIHVGELTAGDVRPYWNWPERV